MVNQLSSYRGRLRLAVASIIIVLIAIIVWVVVTYTPPGSVRLTVALFPSDATLTVDGTHYKNNQSVVLKNNTTHAIRVSRNDFTEHTENYTAKSNDKYLVYLLEAANETGRTWSQNHSDDYNIAYTKAQEQVSIAGDTYSQENPILDTLPYDGSVYTIGSFVGTNPIVLDVDTYSGYRNAAVQRIFYLGFDPGDYTIKFRDYTNPFDSEGAH